MKLCKDCKFFKRVNIGTDFIPVECRHENAIKEIDFGYGNHLYYNCNECRSFRGFCGPNAKYFEPKESFLKRIFGKG